MTIALSTSIPIARMNAASETRCIVPPVIPSSRNVPMTIVSRLNPMITPLRNPIVIIRIAMTINTDSTRLMKKVERAPVTRSLIEDLVASDACRKTFLL